MKVYEVYEIPLTFAENHIDILGQISGERLQDHWSSGSFLMKFM